MLLHEVFKTNDNEQVITWVYEQGSFVPSAKLVDNKSFSIVSDYIGRPIQVYPPPPLVRVSRSYPNKKIRARASHQQEVGEYAVFHFFRM